MRPLDLPSVPLLLLLGASCASGTVPDASEDLPALVQGNTEFALAAFENLGEADPSSNLFFSPLSISAALGMTSAGAEGETAVQMDSVLGFTLPDGRVHPAFQLLLSRLSPEYRRSLCAEGQEPLVLEIANALWVEESFPLLDGYVDLVERDYGATARNLDFTGDPEAQRTLINDWVDERTRGRIPDLLPPGMVTAMTRVVLTNAVYFLGAWQMPFYEGATREEGFTRLDGSVVQVPMMHQTEWFAFGRSSGCAAISLPYSDGLTSMLVLLPDGDPAAFEASLDPATLSAIRVNLHRTRVDLAMPSFEFSGMYLLNDLLGGMGMTDAFDAALADFSGFTGGRDLFVSAVIHRAWVKVDEAGTEAAAATAVVMAMTAMEPLDPVRLTLDRPFLFLILDDLTGSVLFMGRVADPSA